MAWRQLLSLRVEEGNCANIFALEELLRDVVQMLGAGCALGVAGMECRGNGNPVELFGRGGECFPKRFEIFAEISPTFSNNIFYSQLPPPLPQTPHPILSTNWRSSVEFSGDPAHRHRHLLAQFRRQFHFQQIALPALLQKPLLILVVQKNQLLPIPLGSSHDKPPPVFQPQLPSHRKTLWNQAFMSDPFHGYFGKTCPLWRVNS